MKLKLFIYLLLVYFHTCKEWRVASLKLICYGFSFSCVAESPSFFFFYCSLKEASVIFINQFRLFDKENVSKSTLFTVNCSGTLWEFFCPVTENIEPLHTCCPKAEHWKESEMASIFLGIIKKTKKLCAPHFFFLNSSFPPCPWLHNLIHLQPVLGFVFIPICWKIETRSHQCVSSGRSRSLASTFCGNKVCCCSSQPCPPPSDTVLPAEDSTVG